MGNGATNFGHKKSVKNVIKSWQFRSDYIRVGRSWRRGVGGEGEGGSDLASDIGHAWGIGLHLEADLHPVPAA